MFGPQILARTLQSPGRKTQGDIQWQYHSRSDRHSKVASWGVAFDLLATSALLRSHAEAGKVVLGVNHTMRDYATNRSKDLDLVVARPESGLLSGKAQSFKSLVDRYEIKLEDDERALLDSLPDIQVAPVGAVLIAMEAKACMTAHVKSLPRLYDELNSSHLCIHGASSQALAIAYVQVNASDTFISPNPTNVRLMMMGHDPVLTIHKQPADTKRVLDKVGEIPRRSNTSDQGFDAIGVTVLDIVNDGSDVEIDNLPPAPQPGEPFHYGSMIVRMAHEYDSKFARI